MSKNENCKSGSVCKERVRRLTEVVVGESKGVHKLHGTTAHLEGGGGGGTNETMTGVISSSEHFRLRRNWSLGVPHKDVCMNVGFGLLGVGSVGVRNWRE